MDHNTSEWMAMASTDLGVAKHLFDTYYPKPLDVICYHCQQCAEKAIKAVIIAKYPQSGMPKLHDLSFLLNQLKNAVPIEEKYYDYADSLTPYGVSIRYPHELSLEDRHALTALQMANELLHWAGEQL